MLPLQLNLFYTDKDGVTHDGYIDSDDVYVGEQTLTEILDSKDHWDLAYSQRHTHSNKSTLDKITSDDVDHWSELSDNIVIKDDGEYPEIQLGADSTVDTSIAGYLHASDIKSVQRVEFHATSGSGTYTLSYDDLVKIGPAYDQRHTHSNKTVLDGISSTSVSNWNTAYNQRHTHSNQSVLNGISSTDVSNWDSAYDDSHTHVNLLIINSIDNTDLNHWNTAYDNNHTHSNKSVLDGISSTDVSNWDAKVDTSDLPNIKKNTSSTSGDRLSTHLTVGSRSSGTYGNYTLSVGSANIVSGTGSCGGGYDNEISTTYCFAYGRGNTISGNATGSGVVGGTTTIDGQYSFGCGSTNDIGGWSFAAGSDNEADGGYSFAMGYHLHALACQMVTGHYAKDGTVGTTSGTSGDAFVIGNGTSSTASNAFRVTYAGAVYGKSSYHSTGADYAEYFEWSDGNQKNEDRRGLFVAFDGDKIKLANNGDEIIGIVSSTPSVVGNAYEDDWQGMYQTDIFGQPLSHIVHYDAEYQTIEVPDIDDDGNELQTTHTEQELLHEAYDAEEYILNPNYDPKQEYIPRSERKEWAVVGLMGQLVVVDDGTCSVNGYCTVGENGVATASDSGYRVLKRLDETHVKVFIK